MRPSALEVDSILVLPPLQHHHSTTNHPTPFSCSRRRTGAPASQGRAQLAAKRSLDGPSPSAGYARISQEKAGDATAAAESYGRDLPHQGTTKSPARLESVCHLAEVASLSHGRSASGINDCNGTANPSTSKCALASEDGQAVKDDHQEMW